MLMLNELTKAFHGKARVISLTSDIKRSMTRQAADKGRAVVKSVRNQEEAYMEVWKP